jgi:signal transduction histidine kinase
LRDLTHHLATLEELARKHEQLLQAERLAAIGQMAAGIAHESGNALQRSQACLDLLARRVTDLPKAAELVARIQEAQDHLQRLHGEVREYAAPIRIQPQPCDLAAVVERAWDSLALSRQDRGATLEQRATVPLACRADAFALEQVFRNLLKNALEASTGEARIDVTWSEEERDGKSWRRAAVRDHGRGMTEEERRRIFEPFFTTKTRGTGLGLAIVRRLVEAHGGTVEPNEVAGPGTEIVVRLPKEKHA